MNKRKKTGVQIIQCRYNVNMEKGTTTCILTCVFNTNTLPKAIKDGILGALVYERVNVLNQKNSLFNVIATVRCHEDDSFDEQKGKRLAESKAKKMLFNISERYWGTIYHFLQKSSREIDSLIEASRSAKIGEITHYKALKG